MSVVKLTPGSDIQSAIDQNPEGTTFELAAGTYRGQELCPKAGQQFIGDPGAVLNGSIVLDNWTCENGVWHSAVLPPPQTPTGVASAADPLATAREDLFVDNTLYQRVDSPSELGAGKWYYDAATNTACLATDPGQSTVEYSALPYAFQSSVDNVTLQNITIEKYASGAQASTVQAYGTGWNILDCTIRWNHGSGVMLTKDGKIIGGHIVDNGQIGIAGYQADGGVVSGVEIAGNNYAGYDQNWEAGGIKLSDTAGAVVEGNYVHDNNGMGIWFDISSSNATISDNIVADNAYNGIYYEISYGGRIFDNVVFNNGGCIQGILVSDQIALANSSGVSVTGNRVATANPVQNGLALIDVPRGSGPLGPWVSAYNVIQNNEIWFGDPASQNGTAIWALLQPNVWDNNHYHLADPSGSSWSTSWQSIIFAVFKALTGYDQHSTVDGLPPDWTPASIATASGAAGANLLWLDGGETVKIGPQDGATILLNFMAGTNPGHDVVWLSDPAITSFSMISAHLSQDGGNAVLDLGPGERITFLNVNAADLVPDDFVIAGITSPARVSGTATSYHAGAAGLAVLSGTTGNEFLDGAGLTHTLVAGHGDDTFLVYASTDTVIAAPGSGTHTIISWADYVLPDNIANLTLAGNGGTSGTGNDLSNILTGTSGNDTLSGMAGDDIIIGNGGSDTMTGGPGHDMFVFNKLDHGVSVITDFTPGEDIIDLHDAAPGLSSAAGFAAGTISLADDGHGGTLLTAQTAAGDAVTIDLLNVKQADLQLDRDLPNIAWLTSGETVRIGSQDGSTVLLDFAGGSDPGHNVLSLSDPSFQSFADLAPHLSQNGSDAVLDLGPGERIVFHDLDAATLGSANFDFAPATPPAKASAAPTSYHAGAAGLAVLSGTTGNEFLDGAGLTHMLVAGHGDDTFLVYASTDTVIAAPGSGTHTIISWADYVLPANVANLTLAGNGGTSGTGNDLSNILTGTSGNDTLSGMAGDDIIIGNGGSDTMTGGPGHDTFVFNKLDQGTSTVTDFTSGEDLIDLRELMKAIGYGGTDPVHDNILHLVASGDGTAIVVDPHGNGDAAAHTVVTLDHVLPSAVKIGTDLVWH